MITQLIDWLSQYDIDEFDKEKFESSAAYFLNNEKPYIFTSEDIDLANEEIFFIVINENLSLEEIYDYLSQVNFKEKRKFQKFIIFEVLQRPVTSRGKSDKDILKIKKNVQKFLSECYGETFYIRNIVYSSSVITKIPDEETIYVSIDSRIKSLEREMKISDGVRLKGYVFSASLKDILELYNILGNTLFEKNLRFNIGEQLGVNESIKKTIEQENEKFWFLNNGISLYINDVSQVDFSIYDKIKITINKDKLPSIINGAQTITASSKALIKTSDPYVLLRLFIFSRDEKECNKELVDKSLDEITVALNRQKPIKTEDIAYTYSFVSDCNNLQLSPENEEYNFRFVRRGEAESILSHRYSLITFARLVKAYLAENPGSARSSGANTLLKGELAENSTDDIAFKDQTIFKTLSGENSEEAFLKNYKPVNFAFKLKSILTDQFLQQVTDSVKIKSSTPKNNSRISDDLNALSKFGRYFLIATYIYKENSYDSSDFSKWEYSNIAIKNADESNNRTVSIDKVKTDMEEIYSDFIKFIHSYKESEDIVFLGANEFKNKKLFSEFKVFSKEKYKND
ncbi:AIPR family protein [Enterococcus sp. AZ072]|uniref:AIPR family protein n=1 Tax=unclassified Enterococcus TaxID=2608891 RepID=UPI003D2E6E52